jgi:dephospho-CoA kinase
MLAETLEQYRETDAVVVFDAPLIVETGFQEAVDLLVVVTAPEDVQVERVRRDRGMSEAEARSRIAAQADAASRISAADRVLTNGADLAALERQVDGLWKELRARAEA